MTNHSEIHDKVRSDYQQILADPKNSVLSSDTSADRKSVV